MAFTLVRREFRGGWKRFRILIACLALGVGAIAGVQSVAGAIFAGLQQDGRAVLGGDISVRVNYRDVAPDQRDYIDTTSEAYTYFIEMRTMARRIDGESATLAELKAVDDAYPLFGELKLRQAAKTDLSADENGTWGALVDPGLAERLRVQENDELMVGGQTFEIRGVIEQEPDRAGSGGTFGFWPRIMVSRESLSDGTLLTQGSMAYHNYRLRLPDNVDPAIYRESLSKQFPDSGWQVRDYLNAAPRLKSLIERVTMFLTFVGLTTLLVGGVGVSNAVLTYLDSKQDTIATFKCLGATNKVVFQIYLIQILMIATIGIAIGLLIGVAIMPIAEFVLGALVPVSFRYGELVFPLFIAASFGFLATVVFTVWPLARTRDISAGALFRSALGYEKRWPRPITFVTVMAGVAMMAALTLLISEQKEFAMWFIAGALAALCIFGFSGSLLKNLAGRIRPPTHPGLRLAVSNLHRPGAVTINVVLSLGLGLTVLTALALVEGNLSKQVNESIPDKAPAFFFIDIQRDQIESFSDIVTNTAGTSNLKRVPYLRARIVKIKNMEPEDALVDERQGWIIRGDRGITYASEQPAEGTIISGEWWPADYSGAPRLSVHKDFVEAFNISLGDAVTLNILGRDITATIANVRELDWRSMQLNFAMMLSPEPMRNAPHAFVATVEATPQAESAVLSAIGTEFPNITIVRIRDALNRVNNMVNSVGVAVRAVAGLSIFAGILVLAGAITAGQKRRIYESVVLKVFGATRQDILKAFSFEYALLGFMAASIASVVGIIVAWTVVTQVMRYEWTFFPWTVFAVVLTCTMVTVAVGLLSTWSVLGQKALPFLRNE